MSDRKSVGRIASFPVGSTSSTVSGKSIGKFVADASQFHGHTFQNYNQPKDSWGEILTSDDMRESSLWGTPTMASNGRLFEDAQFRFLIKVALKKISRRLNLTIEKTRFVARPDELPVPKIKGIDFDEEVEPYPYRANMWRYDGFIQLDHRPILRISRFEFRTLTDSTIRDLFRDDWVRLKKKFGQVWLYPKQVQGTVGTVFFGPAGLFAFIERDYNDGFFIDYEAGFETASEVDEDLRYIILLQATIGALNIIGDGLLAGFSSSSINLDGISESFSSTQGVENAFYGARINTYKKEIDEYIDENRWKFANFPIGHL